MSTVRDIDARGGQHCETTALGVLLRHQGLDLSEPMLFGLGSGLSFLLQAGTILGELSRMEREAMQALSRLEA